MAIKDYTANVEPKLRPLLAADEPLTAAAPLTKDPGSADDVSVRDELTNLLDPTIFLGLGTHPGNLLQRAVFGRAVIGGPGSMGRRLFDAVGHVLSPHVAITDRRLLIYDQELAPRGAGGWRRWLGPGDVVVRAIHEVALSAVLGALAAPAGVARRGRLLVGFVDGSGCTLVCAPPSLAGPVLRAVGPPRPADAADPGEERA